MYGFQALSQMHCNVDDCRGDRSLARSSEWRIANGMKLFGDDVDQMVQLPGSDPGVRASDENRLHTLHLETSIKTSN